MWLFTRYGFFSVVLARKLRDGIPTEEVDPEAVMVRAREYPHLLNLKQHFPELSEIEIQTSDTTDYRHRLVIPKAVWSSILHNLGQELDYTNFKSECAGSGLTDRRYDKVLHEVWHQHRWLQDLEDVGDWYDPVGED